ncbi:uncharacterized protein BO87DRAFT_380438 [Aspergillus neoniger CBS 115656]|uniref:Uncharacterized protein n=1 Tax=Aspergillus neoniger (strain CBS 115656) TaxID=1448310 RepID=A0A318YB71_ASPNB|nr:hypothetical protein BO87DRAFT_380438 [Aspergillus neoniger CBS 115656]PYH29583.1 hypothetical protein BO87DRAFT_380438 [Aspergillus neoniger CBS 115656]
MTPENIVSGGSHQASGPLAKSGYLSEQALILLIFLRQLVFHLMLQHLLHSLTSIIRSYARSSRPRLNAGRSYTNTSRTATCINAAVLIYSATNYLNYAKRLEFRNAQRQLHEKGAFVRADGVVLDLTEVDKNQRASIQKKAEREAKQQAKPAKSDALKQRADTDQDTPTVPAKKRRIPAITTPVPTREPLNQTPSLPPRLPSQPIQTSYTPAHAGLQTQLESDVEGRPRMAPFVLIPTPAYSVPGYTGPIPSGSQYKD